MARPNWAAVLWGLELSGRMHGDIQAVPAERPEEEQQVLGPLPSLRAVLRRAERRKVDRLQTVRFGSACYSVRAGHWVEVGADDGVVVISEGQHEIARHPLVGPGEVSTARHPGLPGCQG